MTLRKGLPLARAATVLLMMAAAALPASAGPLRDRLREARANGDAAGDARFALPTGVSLRSDVPYGPDKAQRMDVYLPARAEGAPVLFLVHGGGWRHGDKTHGPVVQHKVEHWAGRKGYVVVSANYRMLPEADPLEQSLDVARALAAAQRLAPSWGADADRFVLMGHSAGAHLVALLAADPALPRGQGARAWLGTVSLDSAALDVVETMEGRHLRLYEDAFGEDRSFWEATSPAHRLDVSKAKPQPMLLVCSSRRQAVCPQAHDHARRLRSLGGHAVVVEQALTHREINEQLGLPGRYTEQVDRFIDALMR